jgi:hypothetical protein
MNNGKNQMVSQGSKKEVERRKVTDDEVQFYISQACDLVERNRRNGFESFRLEKVMENGRIIFRFIVSADDTGAMLCVYDPAPLVAEYLSKTERGNIDGRREAVFGLLSMLQTLADATAIGLRNAYEVSLVNTRRNFAASDSVKKKEARRFPQQEVEELQRDTLKRISARSKRLLGAHVSGPSRTVTEDRLAAAVGWLRVEGVPNDQITVGHLASRLRCTETAIYKQLKRQRETLEQFLARCS